MPKSKEQLYDYAIVGGGIAGLSTAYHLAKNGKTVLVLDRGNCLENASFNSTAITSHDPDAEWEEVIEKFGIEGAREIWKLGETSMKLLAEYAHRVNPHFVAKRMPAHIFSHDPKTDERLREQHELYKKLGGRVAWMEDGSVLHQNFRKVLTIEDDGHSNNQAILKTLIRMVKYHGGKILIHHEVADVALDGAVSRVRAVNGAEFTAKHVVFSTGEALVHPKLAGLTTKKRTFIVAFEKKKIPKPFRGSVLWDIDSPYHYLRAFRGRVMWVGGNDILDSAYDTKKEYYAPVETYAREVLGFDDSYKRAYEWTGTFYPTKLGLPFIGPIEGTPWFVNLGFGGTGILMSFVSGYLLERWMNGKETHLGSYFSLDR